MLIIRCPFCKERVKKGAIRCKHCHSGIANGNNASNSNDEGIKYLQNGFKKINSECDAIEDRIRARTGFIFIKHQYSSDELYEAASRIESFVEKMSDDIEMWDSANQLNQQVKLQFSRKAQEIYRRLESLQFSIENREPTWWEKVSTVFKRILSKILPFLSFKLVTGRKPPREIAA